MVRYNPSTMGWPEAAYKAARWVAVAVIVYAVATSVAEVGAAREDRMMFESFQVPACPSPGTRVDYCG